MYYDFKALIKRIKLTISPLLNLLKISRNVLRTLKKKGIKNIV